MSEKTKRLIYIFGLFLIASSSLLYSSNSVFIYKILLIVFIICILSMLFFKKAHSFILTRYHIYQKYPDFKKLLQKATSLSNFEKYESSLPPHLQTRSILYATDEKNRSKVLVKYHKPILTQYITPNTPPSCFLEHKQPFSISGDNRVKNEQLAFLISHRLGLGVVPSTLALEWIQQDLEKVLPQSVLHHLKLGIHPDNFLPSFIGVVIQEVIPASALFQNENDLLHLLDQDQIEKAIYFNLLIGRGDGGWHNSVIDTNYKIMEIDNELIGCQRPSSWLFSAFAKSIFKPKNIDAFLALSNDVLENIFNDMDKLCVPTHTCKVIIRNFHALQTFFRTQYKSPIRAEELIKYCLEIRRSSTTF